MKRVLFICTGNTCRSPMAQALLNARAKEKNINIAADSAGLSAFSGDTANENSIRAMAEIGIDISSHRARRFDIRMADEYELIVVMSPEQKRYLEAAGIDSDKIAVMDITDPYGGDLEVYRRTRDEINDKLSNIIKRLEKDDDNFTVAAARPEDIERIAALEKLCFSEPWSFDSLNSCYNNTSYIFFTAMYGQTLAGYASMRYLLDEAEVCNIAVFPEYRRRGAAGCLLTELIQTSEELGLKKIHLEVRASNTAAVSLYKKYGFKEEGIRRGFYEKPHEDALLMAKELWRNL